MLQFKIRETDMCRISKLLAKYDIKASAEPGRIVLKSDDIPTEILKQICEEFGIYEVQNFTEKTLLNEELKEKTNVQEDEFVYRQVKRGEVYWCEFGIPYMHEIGEIRPAIVISNDKINSSTLCNNIAVIPCTTTIKSYPTNIIFQFSPENMEEYSPEKVNERMACALTEQIRSVSKSRLKSYMGKMNDEFMIRIQTVIEYTLGFKDQNKYEEFENFDISKEINVTQVKLLSFVDINELLQISISKDLDKSTKIQKILELFGFDLNKKGVQYLLNAILEASAFKDKYFDLKMLSENVSKKEGIQGVEVMRIIVARVKERFSFRKAPTIEFIRLIKNIFDATNGGKHNEKNNF